jgi:hypothetical protein
VKLFLSILAIIIIAILSISSIYFLSPSNEGNGDDECPIFDTITGDITGKKGDIITIKVTFSDNIEVTDATVYYKTASDAEWITTSILSGKFEIQLNNQDNLHYFVTINDAAGNGPVGNPSIDGSVYYMIKVMEDDENGDEEYIRKVFVEEGSFTTCNYCPMVAEMLYDLYSSGNYNFYYVTLIRTNEKAAARLDNEYNLYGLPTVFIDGGYKVLMGGAHAKSDYAQAIRDAEYRNVPDIQLKVTAEYDNNTNELFCSANIKNLEEENYNGRLRVYLTEKISRWSGPKGEPYHFGFYDFIINKEISIDGNTNSSFNETIDISNLDPANLMVIAAVFNSEKNQAFSDPPKNNYPFDAYYADAADGSELLEGVNLPPTVGFILPEIGKLHILGNPSYDFKYHKNTVLVGRAKIVAEVYDDSGVEKVEFFIDGDYFGKDTEEPYEFSFRSIKLIKRIVGKHTLRVKVFDDEGKTGENSMEVITFFL